MTFVLRVTQLPGVVGLYAALVCAVGALLNAALMAAMFGALWVSLASVVFAALARNEGQDDRC
jgi:hypothetical protein